MPQSPWDTLRQSTPEPAAAAPDPWAALRQSAPDLPPLQLPSWRPGFDPRDAGATFSATGLRITEPMRPVVPNPMHAIAPAAFRVGGAIAGGLAGLPGGPATMALTSGGGTALGETAAQAYEKRYGLRTEMNPTQIVTQAAIGAATGPVGTAARGASVLGTAARRGAQGAALTGAADVATNLAEGNGVRVSPEALGLGLVLGGAGGAVEGRLARRTAAPSLQPSAPAARPPVVNAADGRTPTERLAALTEKQTAALDEAPSLWERLTNPLKEARQHFVNRASRYEDYLREGGIDPVRMDADAGNPLKAYELTAGAAGQAERMAVEVDALVRTARQGGLELPLQELININALERGAETLSRRAADEALEATMRTRARAVGRQPRQLALVGKADAPLDAIGREVARADDAAAAARAAVTPDTPLSVNTATATTRGTAGPMRDVRIRPGTPRTDRITMVPTTDPPAPVRGPRAAILTPEQRAQIERERIARLSGDAAEATQPALFDDLAPADPDTFDALRESTRNAEWTIPSQTKPVGTFRTRGAAQAEMEGLPTAWELQAINDRIDRAKLGSVDTRTTTRRIYPRFGEEDVARIAADTGVADDHVRAFTQAANRKGGLPEWTVRSEILDAKRRGGWQTTIDTTGTASAPGLGRRLATGQALPEGFTPKSVEDLRQVWRNRTDLTPEQKSAVEGMASRLFLLNQKALEAASSAGLISKEVQQELLRRTYAAAESGTGGYAPLTRMMDDLAKVLHGPGVANVDVATQHYLYRLNGSARTTLHPLEASLQKAAVAYNEAARNTAVRALVDLRKRGGFFADTIVPLAGDAKPGEGWGLLTLFEDGTPTRYAVPAPVAEAFKLSDPPTANLLWKALQAAGGVFRTATTMANVAFGTANVPRDVGFLSAATGRSRVAGLANPALWADWGRAAKSVLQQDDKYLRYLDSGAAFSGFQANLTGIDDALKLRVAQGKTPVQWAGTIMTSPLTFAKKFNSVMEDATKLTAFNTFSKTLGPKEAAWQTRRFGGSPDFARRGESSQVINTLFPFFNASVQGFARIGAFAKAHPGRAASAGVAALAKMALLQELNNSWTDPDGTRSWDRITDREKQQNWILLLPGTFADPETGVERRNYVKMPVTHELNVIRAPLQAALDPSMRDAQGMVDAMTGTFPMSPQVTLDAPLQGALDTVVSSANPLIRVPAEQGMNRDAFRGVPIVSRRLEGVAPEEQFTERTSPTATAAGRAAGLSPQRLEHAVRGFGGGVGQMVLDAADTLHGERTQRPVTDVPGVKALTETPVLSGVTRPIARRFLGGPSSIDAVANAKKERFYATLNEATQVRATVNKLKRDIASATSPEGRADAEGRLATLLQTPRAAQLIGMAGRLNTLSQKIAEARRLKNFSAEASIITAIDTALADLKE